MVDNQHWLDRWQENRIGFHEPTVNQHLQTWFKQFALKDGATVFMPLCGKANDIAWIAQQGYQVLGIELSQLAVEAFFEENSLDFDCDETERFRVYRAGSISLLQGDFFDLRARDLADCSLVYDRASLIAMEKPQRPDYYAHMLSIIPAHSDMLLITLEYDQAEMTGPPFSVPVEEVYTNYTDAFTITQLDSCNIVDERPRWRKVGLSALQETVFRLQAKA